MNHMQRARLEMLDRDANVDAFTIRYFSGTTYSLWKVARPLTARYGRGLVLDAGSGHGAWKSAIGENGRRESVDIAAKGAEQPTWTADIMAMPEVPTGRYDAVICHQVLEHVSRPSDAIAELHRVLKPGGHLVLSVPHLSRQHELPYDFFRFTPIGLKKLLSDAGFDVITVSTYGGICTFLHHQFSTLLLGITSLFYPIYLLFSVINSPISIFSSTLDRFMDKRGLLANGVIAVARKFPDGGIDA